MTTARTSPARSTRRRTIRVAALSVTLMWAARTGAQQLDESCTVTVNGQTVQVNPNGTFVIPNVAAPDLFGPGGPGTAPDFLSDDFLRLVGTCIGGGPPQYVYSECFRIRRGESFAVGELTFSGTPPQAVASILAAPGAPTLTTVGQQTPVNLTGFFTDGTSGPLDPILHCPATFRTSNAAILTVAAAPGNALAGLATAKAPGTALITVSLEGATAVTSITVSLGDPLTSVTGVVQTADGDPLNGATVRLSVNGAVISGTGISGGPGLAPGQFMVPNVASQLGPISAYAEATFEGASHSGVSPNKPPVPGGFTDAGLITLDDRILWVTNANGSWQNGSNWISGAPPTPNQIAVIDVPQAITVTHSSGTSVIKGLQCAETLVLSGGSLAINGESNVDGPLTLSGATLGGTGTLTIAGPLNWTGGTMSGTGRTVIAPTGSLSLSGASNKALFRVLENHSPDANWTNGHILFGNGTFTNVSFSNQFGTNAFANAGTFVQNGPGTVTVGVSFNNTGTVYVLAGALQLNGGGADSGQFEVDPGATLSFAGDHTHTAGALLSGAGTVTFTSGTHTFSAGTFDPTGSVNFTGGTVTVNNTFAPAGLVTISGTFNSNAPQTFDSVTLSGTLGGSGQVTVTGPLNWTGGTMSGTGRTVIAPTGSLSMSGPSNKALFRVLENHSPDANWTNGHILFGNGTFTNESDGTFTATLATNLSFSNQFGTNAFANAGTFVQNGPGTVTVGVPFNNTGTVGVQDGAFQFNGAFTQSDGSTELAGGAITKTSGVMQINGGAIGLGADTSSGTITGNVTLGNAAAGVVPRPGAAGTLTVTGTYTQTAGTLDIELGGTSPGTGYDRLVVGGNAALGGVLQLTVLNGFVPKVGQQFQVLTATGTLSGAFTDVATTNFAPGLGASVIYTAGGATVTIEPD